MGNTLKVLNEIRDDVAPGDPLLKAARDRRSSVLTVAKTFPGVRDDYVSGSIAHGTANEDLDADCGVILDRRVHAELGPDGDDEGPTDVLGAMRAHLKDGLREEYPDSKVTTTKRALKIAFNEPVEDEFDPSVDLIVALERKDEPGLWIPNTSRPGWDPSHPQKHTELLTAEPKALRVTRARIIRLAKAWNSQYGKPGLCSFNIEALALTCIDKDMGVDGGLGEFFEYAADDVADRLTPDPADVSPAIKLLYDKETVVSRLQKAAKLMAQALGEDGDEDAVREALADLFPEFVEAPTSSSRAALAQALSTGNEGVRFGRTLSVGGAGTSFKTTRSHGDDPGVPR